ncbi:MAG: PriCT-2 domain-containing protein [Chitinophagaceae bacterium]|nr:PriCT-2 domain-containing protein [Chitinophagaceae bacterium]
MKIKSVLNVLISLNPKVYKPELIKDANLLDCLLSDENRQLSEQCRTIPKNKRNDWKAANVPVITVGGRFSYRSANNLRAHSGFVCIDLDGVKDLETLKKLISKKEYVAYVGKSISGTGLFCIVRIPNDTTAETHPLYYDAVQGIFVKEFGTTFIADAKPKSVAAARFVSYDPEAYFNHNATIFKDLPKKIEIGRTGTSNEYKELNTEPTRAKVERLINEINKKNIAIVPTYDEYLNLAFAFAREFGESGFDYFINVCSISPKYDYQMARAKYDTAIKSLSVPNLKQATLNSFFYLCKCAGLDVRDKKGEYKKPLVKFGNRKPETGQLIDTFLQQKEKVWNFKPLITETENAYPPEWDQPCERNPENDYWRLVNWACDLEAAKVSRQFDKGDKILAEMAAKGFNEMPDDILEQYAPTLFNQMYVLT